MITWHSWTYGFTHLILISTDGHRTFSFRILVLSPHQSNKIQDGYYKCSGLKSGWPFNTTVGKILMPSGFLNDLHVNFPYNWFYPQGLSCSGLSCSVEYLSTNFHVQQSKIIRLLGVEAACREKALYLIQVVSQIINKLI